MSSPPQTAMQQEDDQRLYTGEERLIVAMDIGTTHSAVSFVHLYPGHSIDVKMVTKWDGQAQARGDSKIPTVIAYIDGEAFRFGIEACELADNDTCDIAQWFKLHLHPDSTLPSDVDQFEVPPLPVDVTLTQVYVDFMRFLFQSTQNFFEETTPNGIGIWNRLRDAITVILATPNGWDTTQHGFLRNAAVEAELVEEEDADGRLEFVTESEASVHYALAHTKGHTWLRSGSLFVVSDAGGSTVDSVLYECTAVTPKLVLREVCASECVQAGGVFVDRAARDMLREKLKKSKFNDSQVIEDMVEVFETKTKRIFNGNQESNIVDFGGRRDTDRAYGILQGRITLTKNEVMSTFEDTVEKIVESCTNLLRGRSIQHLLLVGGFGDSPFLRTKLKDAFTMQGTEVITIDEPSKKAAAEGSTLWFTRQLVVARAARFTIGYNVCPLYHSTQQEHRYRQHRTYVDADGRTVLNGQFKILIEKDFVMEQNFQKIETTYCIYEEKPQHLEGFSLEVYAWEGVNPTNWITDPAGFMLTQMRHICTIAADLSRLAPALKMQEGIGGRQYWRVDFKILMMFGGTKLRAKLQWEEEGKCCEGPVKVLAGSIV